MQQHGDPSPASGEVSVSFGLPVDCEAVVAAAPLPIEFGMTPPPVFVHADLSAAIAAVGQVMTRTMTALRRRRVRRRRVRRAITPASTP
jgi:hypothetical protein